MYYKSYIEWDELVLWLLKKKSLCSDLINKLNINYILYQRRREEKAEKL